jgi:hypothetical protein
MRCILVVLAIAVGLAVPGLAAARPPQAFPYPPSVPVAVSTPTAAPGATVRITATGYLPGEAVRVAVRLLARHEPLPPSRAFSATVVLPGQPVAELATTADANGAISLSVPVGNQTGTAAIFAGGLESRQYGVTTVKVLGAEPVVGPGGAGAVAVGAGMPATGTNGRLLLWQVLLAAVAIGIGGALLFATPRRRGKTRETE